LDKPSRQKGKREGEIVFSWMRKDENSHQKDACIICNIMDAPTDKNITTPNRQHRQPRNPVTPSLPSTAIESVV
jgi:hypothetical protein